MKDFKINIESEEDIYVILKCLEENGVKWEDGSKPLESINDVHHGTWLIVENEILFLSNDGDGLSHLTEKTKSDLFDHDRIVITNNGDYFTATRIKNGEIIKKVHIATYSPHALDFRSNLNVCLDVLFAD